MNLLQLLTGSLTTNNSVNSVSQQTGLSSKIVKKLLIAAIPVLITYLTKNASTQSGANSLLGALSQHTNTNSIDEQISNADTNDGAAIINHILGKDKDDVVSGLASQTGATSTQVNNTLSTIAPALLSGLSAVTTSASQQQQSSGVNLSDGLDLGDLVGLFSGSGSQQQSSSNNPAASLFGSLLGGGASQQQSSSNPAASLIGSLLGGGSSSQQQSSSNPAASLIGSLLGSGASQQQQQSASNGTQLLNVLTSLMK